MQMKKSHCFFVYLWMNITIFAAQYLSMYMFGGLQNLYVTYVHLILEVTVTDIGDIFSNDFKIVAPTSSQNLQNIPPTCDQIIDEVFLISQYWGEG